MRDPESGNSKGFAFIKYASFDASDAAIDAMNGQHLCNKPISVSYAFKKESKGEKHGSAAERLLAAQNPLSEADRPHQIFADAPPTNPVPRPEYKTAQKTQERILQEESMKAVPTGPVAPPPLFGQQLCPRLDCMSVSFLFLRLTSQ
jgi:RNA recognition motif-containing protein